MKDTYDISSLYKLERQIDMNKVNIQKNTNARKAGREIDITDRGGNDESG